MYKVGRAATKNSAHFYAERDQLSDATDWILAAAAAQPGGPDVVLGDPKDKELFGITKRHGGSTPMSKRNPGLCKAGTYGMAIDEED